MTAAATAFDIDNDGDLDIVTHPVNGPLIVFTNTTQRRGIVVALRDRQGNRDGIGAVLTLTDDQGDLQSRELQIGGGFMSFDAPRAHFGLQDGRMAKALHVRWADGSETILEGSLQGGTLYTVNRQ
jgi:hypothetical protein